MRTRGQAASDSSQAWYVAEGQRGEQLLQQGHVEQATAVFEGILRRLGHAPSYGRAVALGRLARCFQIAGQHDVAVRHVREAIAVAGMLPPSVGVKGLQGMLRSDLGDALRASGQHGDARKSYQAALKIAEELRDFRGQGVELGRLGALVAAEGSLHEALTHFESARRLFQRAGEPEMEAAASHQLARIFGILAASTDEEARTAADRDQRAALEVQARDYRELQRHAPLLFATLARIGAAPSYGRAVMLGHLGRCWYTSRRPDLAIPCVREAIRLTAALSPNDDLKNLRGALHLDLGDMLRGVGHDTDAREAHETALNIAEQLEDVRGQARVSQRLGRIFQEQRQRSDASIFEVTTYEDVMTDYVFDTDLLVDGPRERRILRPAAEPEPLGDTTRPMLLPCARTWMDEGGAIRFGLPSAEPLVERHSGCTRMQRIRREVEVSGSPGVLWRVIRAMDGTSTMTEILCAFSVDERVVAGPMIAALAATGAIDISGRAVGRFIHVATKKGVLPGGGLEGDAVLRLATDGNYREYPEASRIAVNPCVPVRLRPFHALTRSRRSSRDYRGVPLGRSDFDALLHTACGITGAMPWAEREVKLRAYPSSGALYAVEIYPVVFRVEGLEPAVYHYRASENVLEVVKPHIDPSLFIDAALPVERDMVTGAAALFCLTGCFPRHERKYGQGGYRMLVAEAGHVSQNLNLAATALGLSARPFGGVFDDLLNRELGLEDNEEQFLLAVLVGHAGSVPAPI